MLNGTHLMVVKINYVGDIEQLQRGVLMANIADSVLSI